MTDLAVETVGLRKDYRRGGRHRTVAVDDLHLAVPPGSVHGLLGPDGAGKTTTLRLMLGLARPTSGTVRLLGEEVPRRLGAAMPRVGALVDRPRFLGALSGRRNLELLARTAGAPTSTVPRALDRVGLTARGEDRCARYSPALRHRLAIASALVKDPELVVLDEPVRGLDVAGAHLVHEMVRDLAEDGATVVLTSHLLAEVQQICDTVTVMAEGRQVSTGEVDDLVGRDRGHGVWVSVSDPGRAVQVLAAAGLSATREGPALYVEGASDPARITEVLARQGLFVRELVPDRPDLEAVTAVERPDR